MAGAAGPVQETLPGMPGRPELNGSAAASDARIFASNARLARQILGLSLRDLRDRSGIAVSIASRIEHGENTSLKNAALMARGLGVPLHELFREDFPTFAYAQYVTT